MRLFTALLLSEEAREHLDGLRGQVAKWLNGEHSLGDRVKWVPKENLHVTLNFFGEIPEGNLADLRERLLAVEVATTSGLRVWSEGLELLPQKRGPVRVIAAGVGGDVGAISQVQLQVERVRQQMGLAAERRAYLPHITLGRCREALPGFVRKELVEASGQKATRGPTVEVSSFALMKSETLPEGPRYEVVGVYRLV